MRYSPFSPVWKIVTLNGGCLPGGGSLGISILTGCSAMLTKRAGAFDPARYTCPVTAPKLDGGSGSDRTALVWVPATRQSPNHPTTRSNAHRLSEKRITAPQGLSV